MTPEVLLSQGLDLAKWSIDKINWICVHEFICELKQYFSIFY